MLCTVVNDLLRTSQLCEVSCGTTVRTLTKVNVVTCEDYYVTSNGKIQCPDATVQDGHVYHLVPRLVGGKGGFGSMLRAIGAQIEKTTNHEACRDLSGRRMRDVNNEKKLKEWVGKAADRERERAQKRKERMERRRAAPKHMFHDPQYQEQKSKVLENLDDALREGLHKSSSATATKRKTAATETSASSSKKSKNEWMGVDIDDLSDSDEDSTTGSDEASPCDDEAQPSCSGSSELVTQGSRQKDQADDGSSGNSSSSESQSPVHTTEQNGDMVPNTNGRTEEDMDTCANCKDENDDTTEKKDSKKTPTLESNSKGGSGLLATLAKTPPKEQTPEQNKEQNITEVDLDNYSSAEELESVGLESLKVALMSRGLKCGGTLEERAARLFSVKGLTPDQIDPSLKSKGGKVKKSKGK